MLHVKFTFLHTNNLNSYSNNSSEGAEGQIG